MIAKPDNGVGAAATKLETGDDVNHFKAEWDHSTVYFFEKFVTSMKSAPLMGLWTGWQHRLFNDFRLRHIHHDLMIYKMDNSYYVLRIWIPNCASMARPLSEFGMKSAFSISSFSVTGMTVAIDTITVCTGGFTIDVYNFALLGSLLSYAAIVAGEEFPTSEFEPQYCLAPPRRANANYVYSEEDLLASTASNSRSEKSCQQPLPRLGTTFIC